MKASREITDDERDEAFWVFSDANKLFGEVSVRPFAGGWIVVAGRIQVAGMGKTPREALDNCVAEARRGGHLEDA